MSAPSSPMPSPDEADDQLEIAAGRRAPFSQLGDWVALSGISGHAKALYWHLAMHVNQLRGDRDVWPSKATLADMMGYKKPSALDRYMDELAAIGAIEVTAQRSGKFRSRNRYTVHQTPPDGWAGVVSLADYYSSRRGTQTGTTGRPAETGKTSGGPVVPDREPRSPQTGMPVDPHRGPEQDEGSQQEEVGGTRGRAREDSQPMPDPPAPEFDWDNPRCKEHRGVPANERGPNCGMCAKAREWVEDERAKRAAAAESERRSCTMCNADGYRLDQHRFPVPPNDPMRRCDHATPYRRPEEPDVDPQTTTGHVPTSSAEVRAAARRTASRRPVGAAA